MKEVIICVLLCRRSGGCKGWYCLCKLWDYKKNIVTTLIPDLKIGDYVLVHAGFAITKIEKAEAEKL